MAIKISNSKGLAIPIAGAPDQKVQPGPDISRVALLGDDYVGMKPTMTVQEGDVVKRGQVLFEDKKTPGVLFTSPGCGRVSAIHRGEKRRFQSIVIDIDGDEAESFETFDESQLSSVPRESMVEVLRTSGLWTSFRTRPYGKTPSPTTTPKSIFVTAIDTNPLAADPAVVLREPEFEAHFAHGLQVLTRLTEGNVYCCVAPGSDVPGQSVAGVEFAEFGGPHPAGLPGTHIHFLDPVNQSKVVWHIGCQDVAAIGRLITTGELMLERVVSLAGPIVEQPKLVRTCLGASLSDLSAGIDTQDARVISGSVISGRAAAAPHDFLGRFHSQVSYLSDVVQRKLLGWAVPGFDKFSITRAFASAFQSPPSGGLAFTTSAEGSVRALVPIGSYDKVMPLDIIPTPLLKSLLVQDTDTAQALGCLELIEEDLALCTFVCPGKNDYGPLLRQCLETIEREG